MNHGANGSECELCVLCILRHLDFGLWRGQIAVLLRVVTEGLHEGY